MSLILTVNKSGLGNYGRNTRLKNLSESGSVLNFSKKSSGRSRSISVDFKTNFKNAIFLMVGAIVLSGIIYLYQVNELANKGYEMKEVEREIVSLKEVNEKNKIKEVELRSMYNIEKMTENLNLVSAGNISYLELGGPVAMR